MMACSLLLVACGRSDLVVEPTEMVAGKTYAQYVPTWWQWAYTQPAKNHPLVYSEGGDFCGTGQPSGEVFFLGPTFGGEAKRPCTVPAGKTLLFPIAVSEQNNFPMDPIQRNNTQLEAAARRSIDSAKLLRVELDGKGLIGGDVAAFSRFRQKAQFSFTVPDVPDNLLRGALGIDYAGTISVAFTDGYWLMLKPLPPGEAGLLRIQSDSNADGYFNDPEATAAVLRDGWFYTGDLATQDEVGNIFIKGTKCKR